MNEMLPIFSSESSFHLQEREAFKDSLVSFLKNLTPETQKSYQQAVREFLGFVIVHFALTSPRDLRRSHIISYKESLEKGGQANQTILKKMSGVSSFCKFLAHDGLVERDIVFGVKRPSARNRRETADLSDKDVRRLFDGMRRDLAYYVHHRAILAVGFYTGLRSREIRHLKIGDYGKVDGHMVIRCVIDILPPLKISTRQSEFRFSSGGFLPHFSGSDRCPDRSLFRPKPPNLLSLSFTASRLRLVIRAYKHNSQAA